MGFHVSLGECRTTSAQNGTCSRDTWLRELTALLNVSETYTFGVSEIGFMYRPF